MNEDPLDRGYEACRRDVAISECPYKAGTREQHRWCLGWEIAAENLADYEEYGELDEQHSWGMAFHPVGDHIWWAATYGRLEKHLWRKRYQDRHALTRPPRAVHREECPTCEQPWAVASMAQCLACTSLICPSCVEEYQGTCSPVCWEESYWPYPGVVNSRAGYGL